MNEYRFIFVKKNSFILFPIDFIILDQGENLRISSEMGSYFIHGNALHSKINFLTLYHIHGNDFYIQETNTPKGKIIWIWFIYIIEFWLRLHIFMKKFHNLSIKLISSNTYNLFKTTTFLSFIPLCYKILILFAFMGLFNKIWVCRFVWWIFGFVYDLDKFLWVIMIFIRSFHQRLIMTNLR